MGILVAYASGSGCTASIAEWIADELRAHGREVRLADVSSGPDPAGFEAVVIGSGVRAGNWHAKATTWLQAHAAALRTRPVAAFSVCLNVMGDLKDASKPVNWDEVNGYSTAPAASHDIPLVAHTALAGWWQPKEFGFAERMIMKMMKAPVGDFRDQDAARAWAREIADLL